LSEHKIKNGVKEKGWKRAMQIVKIAGGIAALIGALWAVGNYFKPDMRALADELARHNPMMDTLGTPEEEDP
jgi:hypothetical protein